MSNNKKQESLDIAKMIERDGNIDHLLDVIDMFRTGRTDCVAALKAAELMAEIKDRQWFDIFPYEIAGITGWGIEKTKSVMEDLAETYSIVFSELAEEIEGPYES